MLGGALGVEQEGAPSPDDAPGGNKRCLPLPLQGHLSLWLWGVLGSPPPSGPSACCPDPSSVRAPKGVHAGPVTWVGVGGCSAAASRYLEKMPHHAPSFGTKALSPYPHVCCTGFLFSSFSPTFPRAEGFPGLCCPWLQSVPEASSVARGSRTWDPEPWAGTQDGHGDHRGPAAHSFPASLHPSHTHSSSRPAAVGIEYGLGRWVGRCTGPMS